MREEGEKNKFQKKKKIDTNIKTIIKEVDEISDNSDMESSNNNKKKKIQKILNLKKKVIIVVVNLKKDSKLKSKNSDIILENSNK